MLLRDESHISRTASAATVLVLAAMLATAALPTAQAAQMLGKLRKFLIQKVTFCLALLETAAKLLVVSSSCH